jgi:hypothetical protein
MPRNSAYVSDAPAPFGDLGTMVRCRGGSPADRITDLASIEE